MAPPLTLTTPRIHLLLDWDGTITVSDTLHLVARIGYAHHNRTDLLAEELNSSAEEGSTRLRPWSEIVQAYTDDLKAHAQSYVPAAEQRTTVREELAYLASLEEVENRSVARVEASGLFERITMREVREGAVEAVRSGAVTFREGWHALLESLYGDPDSLELRREKLSVVSVNWSVLFIKWCLHGSVSSRPSLLRWSNRLCGNELGGFEGGGVATGRLTKSAGGGIRTALDKAMHMPRKEWQRAADIFPGVVTATPALIFEEVWEDDDDFCMTVYIGDSDTDLLCLLAADVGILIVDSEGRSSLLRTLERVGVQVLPIMNWRESLQYRQKQSRCLFCAKDFVEVARWIDELQHEPETIARLMND